MEANNVSGAKLPTDRPCLLGDTEYWEDVTHMFRLDDNGAPDYEIDRTEGDFRCYHCYNCGEEFENFEQVKEHLTWKHE